MLKHEFYALMQKMVDAADTVDLARVPLSRCSHTQYQAILSALEEKRFHLKTLDLSGSDICFITSYLKDWMAQLSTFEKQKLSIEMINNELNVVNALGRAHAFFNCLGTLTRLKQLNLSQNGLFTFIALQSQENSLLINICSALQTLESLEILKLNSNFALTQQDQSQQQQFAIEHALVFTLPKLLGVIGQLPYLRELHLQSFYQFKNDSNHNLADGLKALKVSPQLERIELQDHRFNIVELDVVTALIAIKTLQTVKGLSLVKHIAWDRVENFQQILPVFKWVTDNPQRLTDNDTALEIFLEKLLLSEYTLSNALAKSKCFLNILEKYLIEKISCQENFPKLFENKAVFYQLHHEIKKFICNKDDETYHLSRYYISLYVINYLFYRGDIVEAIKNITAISPFWPCYSALRNQGFRKIYWDLRSNGYTILKAFRTVLPLLRSSEKKLIALDQETFKLMCSILDALNNTSGSLEYNFSYPDFVKCLEKVSPNLIKPWVINLVNVATYNYFWSYDNAIVTCNTIAICKVQPRKSHNDCSSKLFATKPPQKTHRLLTSNASNNKNADPNNNAHPNDNSDPNSRIVTRP